MVTLSTKQDLHIPTNWTFVVTFARLSLGMPEGPEELQGQLRPGLLPVSLDADLPPTAGLGFALPNMFSLAPT